MRFRFVAPILGMVTILAISSLPSRSQPNENDGSSIGEYASAVVPTLAVRAADQAISRMHDYAQIAVWHEAVDKANAQAWYTAAQEAQEARDRAEVTTSQPREELTGEAGSGRCGGDLPPCWVMAQESGGDIHAVNWGGCGGNNCYGKWQFSGAWACHFGLSCDIASWTEAEQDYAARTLWDNGRGCSHWSAC